MKAYEKCLERVRKDYDIYFAAVINDNDSLWAVPEEYRDYDMYLAAVSSHAGALEYVPEHLRARIKQELGL